jgi:hypothetical protein
MNTTFPTQSILVLIIVTVLVKLQTVNLFMQFSLASCHFFVLGPHNTFHRAPSSQTVQV